MENRAFYIKYQQNEPVGIETHFNGENDRRRPLQNVSDLIQGICELTVAFFPSAEPATLGQYTLHSLVDGVENMLEVDTPLSTITFGSTARNPLVIRSITDTVTMDEYMAWSLPQPVYDNPVSRPNSSGSHWKQPAHVFQWSEFKQSVIDWIAANHHQHSRRIDRPRFVDGIIITEEVQSLQPYVKLNLLDISAKCFIPPSEFKARRQIDSCKGDPDHLMTRKGQIMAIIEEKGRWTLSNSDIVGAYNAVGNGNVNSALNQLYHYMRLNHRRYGILTSYENSWFVYRSQDCSICNPHSVHETLIVSEGISYQDNNPTILQCFSYFNSIVDAIDMDSPPTSKRSSRANSAIQTSQRNSVSSSARSSINLEIRNSSFEQMVIQQAQEFDINDFNLDKVLGEGRCKVYLETYDSEPIALKTADICKHRDMLPELLNEIAIYEKLSKLQGRGIPKLLCHGYLECVLYCVGISLSGSVPQNLNEKQKQMLLNTLERIHEAGILHNDIRKENILIDEVGNPFIIDFGFSTQGTSWEEQMEERNVLLRLIDSYEF